MMIKMLGCGLILFACVKIAAIDCGKLRDRVKYLDYLDGLLTMFCGEVRYGLRPLPELLERLGQQKGGEGFLLAARELALRDGRSARDCFCVGIQEAYPMLAKEDVAILMALGEGLGVCDSETQYRQIQAVRERLEIQRKTARETAVKNSRLYQGLGILGGIFLILLLL